jgi:glycosyltransferase involved in cell wall biosynthesis
MQVLSSITLTLVVILQAATIEVGYEGKQNQLFRVVIEGWRFVPHSYSIVSTYLLSELIAGGEVEVLFTDLPLYNPNWTRYGDLYPEAVEQRVLGTLLANQTTWRNATIRVAFPYDVSARSDNTPVFVVGTSECLTVSQRYWADGQGPHTIGTSVSIVTHSLWSAAGFINVGVPVRKIRTIPLGVDTSVFRPFEPAERKAARARFLGGNTTSNATVFMSCGAMTRNKGIDVLLASFKRLLDDEPGCCVLLLKGTDDLYDGGAAYLQDLVTALQVAIQSSISLSHAFSLPRVLSPTRSLLHACSLPRFLSRTLYLSLSSPHTLHLNYYT